MKFYQQLFMLVIIFTTLSLQSCGNSDNEESTVGTKQHDNLKIDRAIEGKYMYMDKNNVWHIDENCFVISMGYLSASDSESAIYSVRRRPRLENGWINFSYRYQLCVCCFTDEVLEALEEGYKQKEENNSEETDDENPWY